ncbi:right-handed parallel beta-helix repeat-containing protein [Gelidibacter maritimus]|uniref:Right-handed parallel beta-helix repeat-containing protein n=1 Tax=Gelidibacter maritimus TaxID=2761487 RepID=A0A7W2M3G0_9FLAO|nr:hypothetical protein [Gelidibacter maritimus]MBA6152018.1 hypothetical protein [Gelidibacter maritimus]
MKTIQLKFKIVLFLLLVGFAAVSCGDDKKGDTKNLESEQNPSQADKATASQSEAISSNSEQADRSQIAPDAPGTASPDFSEADTSAVLLDCNYFNEHPNAILKDNPKAEIDYVISCMARVDGKLTIEPGVVIAFEQDAGLNFGSKSSFKIQGTAEKPIVLTAKEKIKGFWRGIYTESSSMINTMTYVTVDYAGGNSKAALNIQNDTSTLTLDRCTFSNSKNYGMLTNKRVGKDVSNITMTNCTFTKNKIPFKTDVSRLRLFNDTNKFVGNEKDYIELDGGTIHGDATWAQLDVPYFIQSNFRIEDGVFTVAPGTEVIMSTQKWIHVDDNASLIMVGTTDNPITIRGEHDIAGFWQQINVRSSSPLNEIGHVIIKNAGRTTKKPNGAIFLETSRFLKIHDVVFKNCFEYGISIQNAEKSHLEHANLSLDNTPKLFSDWKGKEIPTLESS